MERECVLIERSARGRPDAFVEVVRRHEVAVHALGVRNGLWTDLALYAASGSLLLTRHIRTARDLPRCPLP